jgi:hypothetical protein
MRSDPIVRLFLAGAALLLAACGPTAVADKDAIPATAKEGVKAGLSEKVGPNIYHNEAYGITATAPDGWYVPDNEMTRKMADAGADIITAEQKGVTKAAMQASVARTVTIFSFMKYAPGTPKYDGCAVMALAENVSILPGIQRGTDYFFHAKNALKMTNVGFEETGPYTIHKIGGRDFDRMDIKVTVSGKTVMQRYHAAKHGEHMVVFIQSYTDEADIPALDKVLDSIKLDW